MQKLLLVCYQKIAPQAKSGKYFQIWFFPRFRGKKWRRSEHAHASYPGLFFRTPGSVPIWGGKKGEFRDWTRSGLEVPFVQSIVRRLQLCGFTLAIPLALCTMCLLITSASPPCKTFPLICRVCRNFHLLLPQVRSASNFFPQ